MSYKRVPKDKILNPKTNRLVLKNGRVGKSICSSNMCVTLAGKIRYISTNKKRSPKPKTNKTKVGTKTKYMDKLDFEKFVYNNKFIPDVILSKFKDSKYVYLSGPIAERFKSFVSSKNNMLISNLKSKFTSINDRAFDRFFTDYIFCGNLKRDLAVKSRYGTLYYVYKNSDLLQNQFNNMYVMKIQSDNEGGLIYEAFLQNKSAIMGFAPLIIDQEHKLKNKITTSIVVMEQVTGTLELLFSKYKVPYDVLDSIYDQIITILDHFCNIGTVHADFKLDNIGYIMDGDKIIIKIIDFGISVNQQRCDKIIELSSLLDKLIYVKPSLKNLNNMELRYLRNKLTQYYENNIQQLPVNFKDWATLYWKQFPAHMDVLKKIKNNFVENFNLLLK